MGQVKKTEDIYRTLLSHTQRTGADIQSEENMVDVLTDLRLFCDEYGIDFEGAAATSAEHYAHEVN